MYKPVHLGFSIPELSKIVIYMEKGQIYVIWIQKDDIYNYTSENAEAKFDTSN